MLLNIDTLKRQEVTWVFWCRDLTTSRKKAVTFKHAQAVLGERGWSQQCAFGHVIKLITSRFYVNQWTDLVPCFVYEEWRKLEHWKRRFSKGFWVNPFSFTQEIRTSFQSGKQTADLQATNVDRAWEAEEWRLIQEGGNVQTVFPRYYRFPALWDFKKITRMLGLNLLL